MQFGRAYQLGRIGGNFLFVVECTSTYMPDAPSLPLMLILLIIFLERGYWHLKVRGILGLQPNVMHHTRDFLILCDALLWGITWGFVEASSHLSQQV